MQLGSIHATPLVSRPGPPVRRGFLLHSPGGLRPTKAPGLTFWAGYDPKNRYDSGIAGVAPEMGLETWQASPERTGFARWGNSTQTYQKNLEEAMAENFSGEMRASFDRSV